jgi:small subunit ribosomal protein S20
MPIIKSAKKRVRVAKKATIRNSKTKRSLKLAVKTFAKEVAGGKKVTEAHAKAQSELDRAVKKGVMHKNKVARKKRQLAKAAKAAGAAPAKKTTKTVAKKPAAKKTVKKS